MGNCLVKPSTVSYKHASTSLPPATGVCGKASVLMQTEHLTATASSAHFTTSLAQNTYSIIHRVLPDSILAALFEGVGTSVGDQATASLANSLLCQTFIESCERFGGHDESILRATLQALHQKCLASNSIPRKQSQPVGASATLLLLNTTTGECTVANVGHSPCLLTGVSGSFNSKRPESIVLSTLHTTENPKERIHVSRHSTSDNGSDFSGIPLISRPLNQAPEDIKTPVLVTRALGMIPESAASAQGREGAVYAYTGDVAVFSFYLTSLQDHIVIGSSGFWNTLTPSAVALRSHLFSKVGLL